MQTRKQYTTTLPIIMYLIMQRQHMPTKKYLLINHKSYVSVCTFSEATKCPSFRKFWIKASFGPNKWHDEIRFLNFYGFKRHFSCFFAYTNLYHYHCCSPFPQFPKVIAS